VPNLVWNGTQQHPAATVLFAGTPLTEGSDYTLTCTAGNTEIGLGSLTITGTGDYAGTISTSFKILPK